MAKVTVLMPVFNGEKYLHEAINSILNQTFVDFDFLIIDDGSSDKSLEIIKSYQDVRISLVKNNNNRGLVYSLNLGLFLAKGEYIARMDCDDISLPERLEKQVEFLNVNPKVGLVGTWVQVINDKNEPQITWHYPTEHFAIQWGIYFHSPFAHPSIMVRKSIILSNNGYSINMVDAEDYDLWHRLINTTSLANIQTVLLFYRQHSHNITKTDSQKRMSKAAKVNQLIIEEFLSEKISCSISYNLFHQDNQTYQQARDISLLTLKLYKKFKQQPNLTKSEKQYLRCDTANRIYRFFRPHIRQIKSWKFILLSFYLNPKIIIEILQGLLKKFNQLRK